MSAVKRMFLFHDPSHRRVSMTDMFTEAEAFSWFKSCVQRCVFPAMTREGRIVFEGVSASDVRQFELLRGWLVDANGDCLDEDDEEGAPLLIATGADVGVLH